MIRYKYIILIAALFTTEVYSQTNIESKNSSTTWDKLSGGFMQSFEWYDIPIGAAYFSTRLINEETFGNSITIPPSELDEEFTEIFSVQGSKSIGSVNKDYFPEAVFWGRLALATSFSLFSNNNQITTKTFRDIFLFKKALVYTYTLTEYSKILVKRERPDGTDTKSFFSGHTSTTFATSTYLYLELHNFFNSWKATKSNAGFKQFMNISSFTLLYGWAGYVGYSRIRDSKHYLTDVLLGATIGTLTSLFVFNIYHSEEDNVVKNFSLQPGSNSSINLSFNMNF